MKRKPILGETLYSLNIGKKVAQKQREELESLLDE